ncbi:TPA: hypothetical protein ACK3Q6_005265 [Burkholderia cepacia]|uniref:hypothetical protein n=1 Tax=Burkholderia cepacia TaxID=292 RepID=UPI001CF3E35C|nr:hypothetical protein [Burkholderia cepacia]MCA8360895.1 hypothetical protein [Burkholderia cepacia]HDR9759247.1 hypothetical protein [Burkholderia cepacia ATCC 25416]HDV6367843.1 hypothetical protein [Burkholderia cepacia]
MNRNSVATLAKLAVVSAVAIITCTAHAAGVALPQSCETVARFLDSCAADLKLLNYEMGGNKLSGPSGGELRSAMRTVVQQKGVALADQACTAGATKAYGNFANLMMAAGLARYEFSNRCQATMVGVMMVAKRAENAAEAATAAKTTSANSDAARENAIDDHRASTAVQWARAAKDRGMDSDQASESAQQKLPNVSASCPDTKLIKQTPVDFNSPVYKPTIIFASKQCGYAVSYWPADRDVQTTFDSSEIDGWIGYCSTKARGMTTTCTENQPTYAGTH